MKLTAARRALLQLIHDAAPHLFQPKLHSMPAINWLEREGLIEGRGAMGFRASPLGESALREPYRTEAEAELAIAKWRAKEGPEFLRSWVALKVKGGWAVRLRYRRPTNRGIEYGTRILPEGLSATAWL